MKTIIVMQLPNCYCAQLLRDNGFGSEKGVGITAADAVIDLITDYPATFDLKIELQAKGPKVESDE